MATYLFNFLSEDKYVVGGVLLSLDVVTNRLEVIFFFSGDVVTTVMI